MPCIVRSFATRAGVWGLHDSTALSRRLHRPQDLRAPSTPKESLMTAQFGISPKHTKPIGLDSETCPILPGLLAPPLAVLSYAMPGDKNLVSRAAASDWFRGLADETLKQPEVVLVGHNFAYDAVVLGAHDMALLPVLFNLYDRHKIYDTMLNEQLRDIRDGNL